MLCSLTCAETRGAHRVVLNLEQAEVERVLGEVGCQRCQQWRNNLPWSSLRPSCILPDVVILQYSLLYITVVWVLSNLEHMRP